MHRKVQDKNPNIAAGKHIEKAFRVEFVLLVLDDVLAGRSNNVAS